MAPTVTRLERLEPQRKLTDAELREACARLPKPAPYAPSDPYREISPNEQRIAYIVESFVRGRRGGQ